MFWNADVSLWFQPRLHWRIHHKLQGAVSGSEPVQRLWGEYRFSNEGRVKSAVIAQFDTRKGLRKNRPESKRALVSGNTRAPRCWRVFTYCFFTAGRYVDWIGWPTSLQGLYLESLEMQISCEELGWMIWQHYWVIFCGDGGQLKQVSFTLPRRSSRYCAVSPRSTPSLGAVSRWIKWLRGAVSCLNGWRSRDGDVGCVYVSGGSWVNSPVSVRIVLVNLPRGTKSFTLESVGGISHWSVYPEPHSLATDGVKPKDSYLNYKH